MDDTPRDIVFTRHPASKGLHWLREAAVLFAKARVHWLLLLLAYYVVLGIIRLIPVVGVVAVPLLKPVFAVGFLAAAWTVERGGRPRWQQVFQGFQSDLRALLPIGVVFTLGIIGAVAASALVDEGRLLQFLANPPAGAAEGSADAVDKAESVFADSRVELGMLFATLCAIPVLLATWFAPALVVFQSLRAGQALSTSLRAALANWRPILVYVLALFVIAGVVPTALLQIVSLLVSGAGEGARTTLAYLFVLPYMVIVITIVQISDYVSYRDVFHAGETLAPLPAK